MWSLIVFAVFYFFWRKFKPEIEYIKKSSVILIFYSHKRQRNMLIFKIKSIL